MFGNITDLPTLKTYEQALAHYESIVPIRGSDNVRPICKTTNGRRKKQYQIHKYNNGAIACRLYDTDVLVFRPDGEITFHNGGWPSNTTHSFATGILSITWIARCMFSTNRGRTLITLGSGEKLAVENDQVIKLRWNPDKIIGTFENRFSGCFEFIDKPKMYSYFVRRKALSARRKAVDGFRKECMAYAKLVDPDDYKNYKTRQLVDEDLYRAMTIQPDDSCTEKERAELVDWVLHKAATHSYDYSLHKTVRYISAKGVATLIDDVIKYVFFEEVFEKQEVDKPNTNANAKYENKMDKYL
jgi:hypothetical protein